MNPGHSIISVELVFSGRSQPFHRIYTTQEMHIAVWLQAVIACSIDSGFPIEMKK